MAARAAKRCECGERGTHECTLIGDRIVSIFSGILRHTKGRWANKPFLLDPWQEFEIVRPLLATVEWRDEFQVWARRYRVAWLELARKNGKSELLAALALILLGADGEGGAEVYGAAKDREQAGIVFNVAARMVELSPVLSKRLRVYRQTKRIVDRATDSWYQVVAADAAGNLGHNPHGIIFDEIITQPNAELWNALRTGMGARVQPLLIAATTAGNDPKSFAALEHEYSEAVVHDPQRDPRRFVFMRNTPKDTDWRDESVWPIANPALGSFLDIEALRDEAREAELAPRKQNAFRQFRLNEWVQQATRWLDLAAWDATAGMVVEDKLEGRECFGGLDLSATQDVTALCWDFPSADGSHDALWRFWLPEARLLEFDERTAGMASVWVREGFLRLTEGEIVDYDAVLATIDADARRFKVRQVAFDRWGAVDIVRRLDDRGVEVVSMGQGFASMSAPTKAWERLILAGQYRHGGNPLMRWMADNLVASGDPAGNVKLDKAKSHEKIDGAIAAVMALDRALTYEPRKRYRTVSY